MSNKPNIVIFITDQDSAAVAERWPQSFKDEHFPAEKRLKQNGLTFNKMFTVATACSPSRATLLTSNYPSNTGVRYTIAEYYSVGSSQFDNRGQVFNRNFLPPHQVSLSHVLQAAGYKVYWKGKWHLSLPQDGTESWTVEDVEYMKEAYGFDGWNPIDAGVARRDFTKFAKGTFYNDERYLRGTEGVKKVIEKDAAESKGPFCGCSAEEKERKKQQIFKQMDLAVPLGEQGILDFIENIKPEDGPFCLIVSLVNPHDIHVAPTFEKDAGYPVEDIPDFKLPIPGKTDEDLAFKPEVQEVFKRANVGKEGRRANQMRARGETVWYDSVLKEGDEVFDHPEVQQKYVNFYAYLKTLVDNQMNEVLDALDAKGLIEKTLIMRTSDHGEMCLTHDAKREKAFNAYEETLRVPLIISNPGLFPNPVSTDTLATTLDIVPTVAKFVGVYDAFKFAFQGCDLTPVFGNPQADVRDGNGEVRNAVHFAYDDGNVPEQFSNLPIRIRTIRTDKWKYSVYFNNDGSNYEFELYDLENDPYEKENLAGLKEYKQIFKDLHKQLQGLMLKLNTVPQPFAVYTDEMRQRGFMPPLNWPTEEEAFCEALMDYAGNKAESEYRIERREAIKTKVGAIDPDEWWAGI
jgi:arylsulfatase A-like enzyme